MDKGPLGLGANLRITSDVFPEDTQTLFFLCFSLSRASGAKLSNSLRTLQFHLHELLNRSCYLSLLTIVGYLHGSSVVLSLQELYLERFQLPFTVVLYSVL